MTRATNRDLEYHIACREVCEWLGLTLYGSSTNAGCSAYCGSELVELPHRLIVRLQAIQAENEAARGATP